jgi:prepilin-type N-terminal cleavage/methylation domain-containing protein
VSGRSTGGFTLIEILVAITIVALAMTVASFTFTTATKAWRRGTTLVDSIHHGDFVVDQLSMALRSAYYPDAGGTHGEYGFVVRAGEGGGGADIVSWVKLGSALVGKGCPFAGSPHRVEVTVERHPDGNDALAVRAWRLQGQTEEFDPKKDVEPVYLSRGIRGFTCRTAMRGEDGELEWPEVWEETNRLPLVAELTVHMDPLEEGGPPVEVKRVVAVPAAPLSWRTR